MLRNLNRKWMIIVSISILALNALAFYLINVNIGNTLAASKMNDPSIELANQQEGFPAMIFAAVVITLDIFFIMYLLFLLYKLIAKTLNNSLPKKP